MAGTEAQSALSLARQRVLGDRIMMGVIWCLLILALALAPIYGAWREAIFCGVGFAGAQQLLMLVKPGCRITRVASAIVFMCFAALIIDEMHGMIEMHFSIFVLLAFLLFYSDWLPLVVGAAAIAVHHLGFHLLQTAGYPVWVFPHACGLSMVIVHAAFVVFETALLIMMSMQHERAAIETGEVISMLDSVLVGDYVDLSVTSKTASGPPEHFGRLIGILRELVDRIIRHAETIVSSSETIASSASGVSAASGLQKEQIGRAAVAIQQMRSAVSEINQSSQKVAANMMRSKKQAVEGGRVVADTVAAIQQVASSTQETSSTIEELGQASESIGKIVDTINDIAGQTNDIAGQTNLLALNASIEAARAGELGRGFAVVAGEVRMLAERTAKATKEIGEMISSIQQKTAQATVSMRNGTEKVEAGVHTAEKAGDALQQIIREAEAQNVMMAQIASASSQQSATTDQVKGNMDEILKMAEQSVASAGESAHECTGLSSLAIELQGLLHRFQTGQRAA